MSRKKITNEMLCATLITQGTVKDTAKVLRISERTIYSMISDNDFKMLYDYAQADILSNSVALCQNKLADAINCIADIMNDKDINAQTRLLAAQTIIKNSLFMYDATEKMREKAENQPYNFL